jgi:hypothetical protein
VFDLVISTVTTKRRALRILRESEKLVLNSLSDLGALYIFMLQELAKGPLSEAILRGKCMRKGLRCRGLCKIISYMIETGYIREVSEGKYALQHTGLEISNALNGFRQSLLTFIEEALEERITGDRLMAELLAPLASTLSVAFLDKGRLESPAGLTLHGYICMIVASVLSNTYNYSKTLRESLKEAEFIFLGEEGEEG